MKRLLCIIILLITFVGSSTAEEYNLHIADIDQCNNFDTPANELGNANIHVDYLDLNYDDTSQTLTIEVAVDDSRGKLANLFHLVLTDGPMPSGEGSAAHIYFDASSESNPLVNAFVYNGRGNNYCANYQRDNDGNLVLSGGNPIQTGSWTKGNTSTSWYHAQDPIITSKFSGDFQEVTVSDITPLPSGATEAKLYRLILDASTVNAFSPAILESGSYHYGYDGIQIGEHAGVWFWAAGEASTSFGFTGYLNNFDANECAVCDQTNFETKQKPVCAGSTATINPVEIGESTKIAITVQDPDCNDTDATDTIVTYSNLPSGATTDVPEGGTVSFNNNCEGTVTVNWTPKVGDQGNYTIGTTFSKDYGLSQLAVQCSSVEVEVDPVTPDCKISDISPITQADQDLGRLAKLATDLKRATQNLRKKVGNKKAIDKVNVNLLHRTGWEAYNAIINQGEYFFECTNTEACIGGVEITSLSSEVSTFDEYLTRLTKVAKTRANKYKKAYKTYLIKGKGLSKKAANRKAKKRTQVKWLNGKNNDGINPSAASARTQFELHRDTYGDLRYTCVGAEVIN